MLMKKKIVPLFLSLLCYFSASAQEISKLPCLDKQFSVVVHIVKDSLGQSKITQSQIETNFTKLNAVFDSICVSFKVCEYRYIENFRYDSIDTMKGQWNELINQYHALNKINVFYVDEIVNPSGATGFASLAHICVMNSGGIVLKKSSSDIVLAHEMGHFFGLNHTWNNKANINLKSVELVNGSNSLTSGDEISDTPADPFVKGTNPASYLSSNPAYPCKFIGKMLDANGLFYDPLVGNTMSYYPETCNCGFTREQYMKMAETFLSNPKMW